MSYLLSSLITILSLYSHTTVSESVSITGSDYKLSTHDIYYIYNPDLRQYLGYCDPIFCFEDDNSTPGKEWKIEKQTYPLGYDTFALMHVASGKYINYQDKKFELQSTLSANSEYFMGFEARATGGRPRVKDVTLPTIELLSLPENGNANGNQHPIEGFNYLANNKIHYAALCDNNGQLLSTNIQSLVQDPDWLDLQCLTPNLVFIPAYQFSEIKGEWRSIPSCIGCDSSEFEYEIGVTGLTETEVSGSWSKSVSAEVSAGISVGPLTVGGGTSKEESRAVSNSMTTAFGQTASEKVKYICKKDLLYQWTLYGTVNSKEFGVKGSQLACIDGGYKPKCLPTKCKVNTNCQECSD